MKIKEILNKTVSSAATLVKVTLRSRPVAKCRKRDGTVVILGNGPSLRKTLDEEKDRLTGRDLMTVNFAANTEEFFQLRPGLYLLSDPHFLDMEDGNVKRLWANISKADWPLTLYLPRAFGRCLKALSEALPANITVRWFNMTPGEGFDFVCHPLFVAGLAMPRPRNVLIPAIMECIRAGYSQIYIVGADHTWPHTLYVDDDNRVVSVQPHYYEDNRDEIARVGTVYANTRLYQVLESMYVAFRSYIEIERYARKRGVRIYNATPGSLIDAFERRSL